MPDFKGDISVKGVVINPDLTRRFFLESPTDAEDISWFFTDEAIAVQSVRAVLVGSTPSLTIDIKHDPDRDESGSSIFAAPREVTSTTTGDELTLGGDVTIPAGSYVWFETTASAGTVDSVHVHLKFTRAS